jgi:ATP-dependent DNA helicase RecG
MPRNPLIAEPLYRIKYVEKAGTGTTDMIADCRKAGLPEPDFEQRGPYFVVTVWRDWLTDEVMKRIGLGERQIKAIMHLKVNGRITNREYRDLTETIYRTASRDLEDLVSKGVLCKIGVTGRNVHYVLSRKQDINRTNRTFQEPSSGHFPGALEKRGKNLRGGAFHEMDRRFSDSAFSRRGPVPVLPERAVLRV